MKLPFSITWYRYQQDYIEREFGRKLKKKEVEQLKAFFIKEHEERIHKKNRTVSTVKNKKRDTSDTKRNSNS